MLNAIAAVPTVRTCSATVRVALSVNRTTVRIAPDPAMIGVARG